MNTMQKGTIALLKSALLQSAEPLPEAFDLEEAYPVLGNHHMDALLYEGALLCRVDPQLPVMKRLFQNYCRSVLVSEGQLQAAGKIFDAFDREQIDYLPLKGCKMKALYPKAELRMMGDADILIRMEQYPRIIPIMQQLGFQAGVESDHELHWHSKKLFVELHKRVIPSYNKDFYAYFGDGWQLAQSCGGSRYTMTAEDEMVYLFTHFAKHYRDGGIGCRHVVDLWVFRKHHPQLQEETVLEAMEKLHLRQFYENICRLLEVWFADASADEQVDFITDFIFAGGSWGKQKDHITSSGVRDHSGKNARLRYVLRLALPGVDALKGKYTILQKAPWMLPAVWVYRPFYKLLSRKERQTLKAHKRKLQILSAENVQTRQQALQYVGLDYHF